MEKIYKNLKDLLVSKTSDKYNLDSNQFIQLRMFIDSISQNENFGKIVNDTFQKIKNKQKINRSRSIDLLEVYKIIGKFYPELIDLLTDKDSRSKLYVTFNRLRNQDYRDYLDLSNENKDFEIDNGRIKFQYVYVTSSIGNYIILIDDVTYLENIDDLRLKKGLREFTNLGNIKKKQEQVVDEINDEISFEYCYV